MANLIGAIAGLLPSFLCSFCALVELIAGLIAAVALVLLHRFFDAVVTLVSAGLGALVGGVHLPKGPITPSLYEALVTRVVGRLIREGESLWQRITIVGPNGVRVMRLARSPIFKRVTKEIDVFTTMIGTILNGASQMVQDAHNHENAWAQE